MSKYFGFVHGNAYDFKFKKHSHNEGWYLFSLGNYSIAQLIARKCTKNLTKTKSWSVIVQGDIEPETPRLVHGFKTRHAAIDYALQIHPLTASSYNDSLKDSYEIEGKIGERLKARSLNRYSNAVVVKNTEGTLTLLTDFGNIIEQSLAEVRKNFKLHKGYIEAMEIGYPLDSIQERIDTQIQMLQGAKKFCSSE